MSEKTIKELAVELTVEMTDLCDAIKAKSVYTNQLLRSCSSIGANAHEANYAQSRAYFINKLEISLKECYETEYWLEILYKVRSLPEESYKDVSKNAERFAANSSHRLRRRRITVLIQKNESNVLTFHLMSKGILLWKRTKTLSLKIRR